MRTLAWRDKAYPFRPVPGAGIQVRRTVAIIGVFAVGVLLLSASSTGALASALSFTTPVVIGFVKGDDWEPDVAADGRGNVYVAWAHFGDVKGCDTCSDPAALLQVSRDGGRSWEASKPLNPFPEGVDATYQLDLQVKVNAAGSVFVAYLEGKDTVFQRSDNLGRTFTRPIAVNADVKNSWTDKVGLAVRGEDVYVSYSIAQRFFVSASHDGGMTFRSTQVNSRSSDYSWTLTSGGVVDSNGNAYFSWVGVHQSGNALGPQDVFLTKSTDGGRSWSFLNVDLGVPPGPNCLEFSCAWDFWGPQMVVGVDQGDNLYVLYNAGETDRGPARVWYRSSTDGGTTWSARTTIHADIGDENALFPAIVGGKAGQVHASWMDSRTGRFRTWYRTSSDGGRTWSAEVQLSQQLDGFKYQSAAGFEFTYGDYYGIAWDGRNVHVAWGEGPDYIGPGNVFYARSG